MTTAATLKPLDISEAQSRLDAFPHSGENLFEHNTWLFEFPDRSTVSINFDDLQNMHERHPEWPFSHTINWVLLTKRLWLTLVKIESRATYISTLSGLKLFWESMAQLKLAELTRETCSDFLEFFLMHSWNDSGPHKNLATKSYKYYTTQLNIKQYRLEFSILGLNWISPSLTNSFIKKQLQELIPVLTNETQTFRDWTVGGNLDHLNLDYGQYYVEHCLTFFNEQYPLAIALDSTYRAIPDIAVSLGFSERTTSLYSSLLLQGHSPEQVYKRQKQWSLTTILKVYKPLNLFFEKAYEQALFEDALLHDSVLQKFAIACDMQPNSVNIDRLRVILWEWIRRNDKTETLNLLKECHKSITWAVFQKQLTIVRNQCRKESYLMPTTSDYEKIGMQLKDSNNSARSHNQQLKRAVAQSGLITIIALSGWRRSEYGFPRSAISCTRNSDKLDEYAFPWRYQVEWYVKKTHGEIKTTREITFNMFVIMERLQLLSGATGEQPCLYTYVAIHGDKHFPKSEAIITRAAHNQWKHFVHYYSGFKLLDDWSSWKSLQHALHSGRDLTHEEQKELEQLLRQRSTKEWDNLLIDLNLKIAWKRARNEWPRLEMFFMNASSDDKEGWLLKYLNKTLRPDWHGLLDAHLTPDTKAFLSSLPTDKSLHRSLTRKVMSELTRDTRYPTYHAFRHMWAEAVYRRFDGDAGWMIRSQFQHVSPKMWLAYIRDKDNRLSHQRVKEQVISSLVRNYLKHKGEGYAGQLHTFLRRIVKKTSVVAPEEQEHIITRFTTIEFEDLKANPWGYCLLMRRTRTKAKCCEMGEPKRHNASPDLCLGCMHNLMQTENVEWSLLHAATHVEALKNPLVPAIFKASSYKLVKNVMKHVRTLNPFHESLPELEMILNSYKASSTP